jgi:hypothetical protein
MCVGSDVLTALWDIAPCSPYVNRRFGGTNMSRTINQRVAGRYVRAAAASKSLLPLSITATAVYTSV